MNNDKDEKWFHRDFTELKHLNNQPLEREESGQETCRSHQTHPKDHIQAYMMKWMWEEKDGLRKKRRLLWLENEKKRSGHKTANQFMMASHQVLLPSNLCLCNIERTCAVITIYDEC